MRWSLQCPNSVLSVTMSKLQFIQFKLKTAKQDILQQTIQVVQTHTPDPVRYVPIWQLLHRRDELPPAQWFRLKVWLSVKTAVFYMLVSCRHMSCTVSCRRWSPAGICHETATDVSLRIELCMQWWEWWMRFLQCLVQVMSRLLLIVHFTFVDRHTWASQVRSCLTEAACYWRAGPCIQGDWIRYCSKYSASALLRVSCKSACCVLLTSFCKVVNPPIPVQYFPAGQRLHVRTELAPATTTSKFI